MFSDICKVIESYHETSMLKLFTIKEMTNSEQHVTIKE